MSEMIRFLEILLYVGALFGVAEMIRLSFFEVKADE